jgi:hypothetical protein
MIKSEVIQSLIEYGPGRTELELAKAIHGDAGVQQNVNQDCEALARMGRVDRRGAGGPGQPFRFSPTQSPS